MKKKKKFKEEHYLAKFGAATLFMVLVFLYVSVYAGGLPDSTFDRMALLVVATVFGAYMAMNIGANDVANNMGPSVGSGALTLFGAIVIAAIFELMGALIAGGDVVTTIKSGIIDPELIPTDDQFLWVMMSSLLAGALWLNFATLVGAPVSTTHSIVGAVVGAGVMAGGFEIVNWGKIGAIASSWVISPLLGGIIAVILLYTIKRTITYQKDMISASIRVVPILSALMVWAFTLYMLIKGLKNIVSISFANALVIAIVVSIVIYWVVKPFVKHSAYGNENTKDSVNKLFTFPLIFSAALLSFAHGANDVANAIGPLASINEFISTGSVNSMSSLPLWVMVIGALGIVVGLVLFGPRMIRTVGSEITDLDQIRAFCIAMASALTVIFASQLGLPISTTHVAIGAVFGVGFLREYLKRNRTNMESLIGEAYGDGEQEKVKRFLNKFNSATPEKKVLMIKAMKKKAERMKDEPILRKKDRKTFKKAYKKELVKRSMIIKIVAAWVVTVPATALLSAMIYKLASITFGG